MPTPTERLQINTQYHMWEALEKGDLTFYIIRNNEFIQPGNIVKFVKMNKNNTGYDTRGVGGKPSHDLYFKLGFMLQGGVPGIGIEPGFAAFSLVPMKV